MNIIAKMLGREEEQEEDITEEEYNDLWPCVVYQGFPDTQEYDDGHNLITPDKDGDLINEPLDTKPALGGAGVSLEIPKTMKQEDAIRIINKLIDSYITP